MTTQIDLNKYADFVLTVASEPSKDAETFVEHVFYLPFVELCITFYYE